MLLPYYIYRADAKHHEGDSDDNGCKVTQLCAVTAIGQTEQPLDGIPQVEKDVEHLALLQGVYILVTGTDTIQRTFSENDAKEVNGIETLT